MEVAAAIGTITGLIGFTINNAKTTYSYISSVKNASQTTRNLHEELKILEETLRQLRDCLSDRLGQSTFPKTSVLVLTTDTCQKRLTKLNEELSPLTEGGCMFRMLHRLKWPLDEPD